MVVGTKHYHNLDFNLIKVFDAVITEGNATRAAKKLEVTPAAVSHALVKLQKIYEEDLFIRTRDGLVPTVAGKDLHQVFRQVITAIDATLNQQQHTKEDNEIIVLGGDIIESYYFSAFKSGELFSKYTINHYSAKKNEKNALSAMLIKGRIDIFFSLTAIEHHLVDVHVLDYIENYVCICGRHNLFYELEILSLHNFYASKHAMYHTDIFTPAVADFIDLYENTVFCKGRRNAGYHTDSLVGIFNVVENSDMIALVPLKIALYFRDVRNYNIKIIRPPGEFSFKKLPIYACISVKSDRYQMAKDFVLSLKSIFSKK
ncbi:LysR family transcriptional regulator [Citrobacter cronae]|uniref:LysR family transcriptional regulator n=1 Tax=Citrobacter cronae TaxID=1748967 RepID=UPI0021D311DF|nr:LysR family transcriptional regulator [Citrobacter cronae]MCU6173804.1 LysR family transcriptional regulator [Citrobacter cronae]